MNNLLAIGTIHTERLLLRSWEIADAQDLYDYAKNPNVGPHGGWKPHETIEESAEIIRTLFMSKYYGWAVVLKETGRVIGSIAFEEDPYRKGTNCMELGYAMAEEHWGKGIMTEAAKAAIAYGFGEMNLPMIAIYRNPHNTRSGRVIEKCGFHYEGTLRRANTVYNGELRDVACYSMLKSEHGLL